MNRAGLIVAWRPVAIASVAMASCALGFGVLGLTPGLPSIAEIPLLAGAALIPTLILVWTGLHVASRSRSVAVSACALAIVGAIGGVAGGLTYVAFGKPVMNIAVGLAGGLLGGALLGTVVGVVALRRLREARGAG